MPFVDKDAVKAHLTDENIFSLLEYFNAEPEDQGDYFTAITVCHGGDSRKLYWYKNNSVFYCYSHCGPFDVFDLVKKVRPLATLNDAVQWVSDFFNLKTEETTLTDDFRIFKKWEEISKPKEERERIVLPQMEVRFLKNYPNALPEMIDTTITPEVIKHLGYKYDPVKRCWLLPHMDENGRTVGVRQRTLVEAQERFGKYRPWTHSGNEFNHPLGFNLYADKPFWENIKETKTAIVFEGEKSVALYESYFGIDKNIACAMCGSFLSRYQFDLLLSSGVENIVIATDRDYMKFNDEQFKKFVNKTYSIWKKYSAQCNLQFMIDRNDLLGYKCSPIDCGKETFKEIYKDRQSLRQEDFDYIGV